MPADTKTKPAKKTYEVQEDGFILGTHYKAGDLVTLYPAQAQYDLPPHGTMLAEAAASASDTADNS